MNAPTLAFDVAVNAFQKQLFLNEADVSQFVVQSSLLKFIFQTAALKLIVGVTIRWITGENLHPPNIPKLVMIMSGDLTHSSGLLNKQYSYKKETQK